LEQDASSKHVADLSREAGGPGHDGVADDNGGIREGTFGGEFDDEYAFGGVVSDSEDEVDSDDGLGAPDHDGLGSSSLDVGASLVSSALS
jgi:hypothetical protein